jgi:hypothetical protein
MLRKLTVAVFAAALIAVPAFAANTPSPVSGPATHQTEKQTKLSQTVRPAHHVRHATHPHRTKQHLAGSHKVTPSKHAQVQTKTVTPSGAN